MRLQKITNRITASLFAAVLILGCGLTVFLPKAAVSESERRSLAKLPAFSAEALLDGSYFNGLTTYVTDHFVLREEFRAVNGAVRTGIMRQPDVGGVLEADGGYLFQPAWPMDEKSIVSNAKKLRAIADKHFADVPVYFSVIPDKSDFSEKDMPRLDTERVVYLTKDSLAGKYIDITGTLELTDYYRTDTHWRQEMLEDTANALVTGMGGEPLKNDFEWKTLEGTFRGVLWGRYARPLKEEDVLCYGVNETTENAVVNYVERPELNTVYTPGVNPMDPYDTFLSGASSIIEITNPGAETDKHLVLFRDSFGSSIAPWLLTRYEKITMIDIRYVSSTIMGDYAELDTADEALFLYSAAILNTGGILK